MSIGPLSAPMAISALKTTSLRALHLQRCMPSFKLPKRCLRTGSGRVRLSSADGRASHTTKQRDGIKHTGSKIGIRLQLGSPAINLACQRLGVQHRARSALHRTSSSRGDRPSWRCLCLKSPSLQLRYCQSVRGQRWREHLQPTKVILSV